ncbi:organic cation transporter protein-like isoform X2 [Ostrea edulis]|uniref:organic cation transporter protein-like isoform X2 n=1 Tax=Ostrea edulis TaxID=37623 RepID=UPI0024AF1FAB|nr:organic cation transporter protein-like isoform X2 [Ostrea edulis]XP_055995189.1 organic cation transporter protein-like isoform X2 [Ostrea edulis]
MEQNLDVDEIWRALKPWGRYQVKQMLFMWAAQIPCAFHLLAVVFIGFQPKSECADVSLPDNDIRNASVSSVTYGACSVTIFSNQSNSSSTITSCPNGYRYDEHDKISFATEWGLLCGESTKVDLSQSLMLLGQGLGGFLCTVISDKLGRKPVHIVSHISIFILCLTTSFIPSYVGFAILRFFTGVAIEGLMLSSITMYVETLPEEWRFCSEVMGLVWWTTGIVLLTPLALLMQNYSWRYLQLLLSLLSVYSLAEYWLFDESLRWLMANGRLEEAEKVLRKAAEMNKKTFDNIIGDVKKKMAELETLDGGLEKTEILFTEPDVVIVAYNPRNTDVIKYSMLTILKDRMILLNSVIIWFIWVTNSLTYYGLSLMSTTLYGNRFLNFFFLGAMEYLSALAEFSLLNRIGRRKTLFFLLGTAGVSLLVATIMFMFKGESSVLGHLYMFFVLVGKFGISGSFSSSFLYTSELYPTNMRNAGYGLSSIFTRIGGVIAPFMNTFYNYVSWGPGVVFSAMCFISAILICFLPETRGRELPTTIEELRTWYKTHSGLRRLRSAPKEVNDKT